MEENKDILRRRKLYFRIFTTIVGLGMNKGNMMYSLLHFLFPLLTWVKWVWFNTAEIIPAFKWLWDSIF